MARKLSYFKQKMRTKLENTEYGAETITTGVNFAIADICIRYQLPHNRKTSTIVLLAGAFEVALPLDHQQLINYTRLGDTPVNLKDAYMNYDAFDEIHPSPGSRVSTKPYDHTIDATSLRFSAPADKNYAIRVRYFYTPADLVADDDEMILPDEWSEAVLTSALAYCFETNTDYDEAKVHRNRHNSLTRDLTSRSATRIKGSRKLRDRNWKSRRR